MTREKEPNYAVLTLRLAEPEQERFRRLLERSFAENRYISRTHVIRELIGLEPPDILTEADIDYFRSGRKSSSNMGVSSRRKMLAKDTDKLERAETPRKEKKRGSL